MSGGSVVSLAESEDSTVASLEITSEDETSGSSEQIGPTEESSSTQAPTPRLQLAVSNATVQELSPDSIPVKKWYQIDFSPTAFCRRIFLSVYQEPPVREGTPVKKASGKKRRTSEKPEYDGETTVSRTPLTGNETTVPTADHAIQEHIVDLQVQKGDKAFIVSHSDQTADPWNKEFLLSDKEPTLTKDSPVLVTHGTCCSFSLIQNSSTSESIYSCVSGKPKVEMSYTDQPVCDAAPLQGTSIAVACCQEGSSIRDSFSSEGNELLATVDPRKHSRNEILQGEAIVLPGKTLEGNQHFTVATKPNQVKPEDKQQPKEPTIPKGTIARESLIKSTFHKSMEELSPQSARRLLLQHKTLSKEHRQSCIRLSTSLSGRLDEPLLELAEENVDVSRSYSLSSLTLSLNSVDTVIPSSGLGLNDRNRSSDACLPHVQSMLELEEPEKQSKNIIEPQKVSPGFSLENMSCKVPDEQTTKIDMQDVESYVEHGIVGAFSEGQGKTVKYVENKVIPKESLLVTPRSIHTTPPSIAHDMPGLLMSKCGQELLDRPLNRNMSLLTLGKLEVEKSLLFPQIYKARSESRIQKSGKNVFLAAESTVKVHRPCSEEPNDNGCLDEVDEAVAATEEYYEHVCEYASRDNRQSCASLPSLFTFPNIDKSDCGTIESAEEAIHGQFSGLMYSQSVMNVCGKSHERSCIETKSSEIDQTTHPLDAPVPLDGTYEFHKESMPKKFIGQMSPHISLEGFYIEEGKDYPASSDCLTSAELKSPMDTEDDSQPASALKSKGFSNKSGKAGLLHFFRRQSWAPQSSAPKEKVVKRQVSDGDSTNIQQQDNKTLDMSITKKMKASVSSISKVLGRPSGREDKKEDSYAGKVSFPGESCTEISDSSKKSSGLFSFKLPGFKRSREPMFSLELRDQAVCLGQEVTLRCRLTGHPTPQVQWYKEARRLESHSQIRVTVEEREWLSLTIFSAREEDLGSYRCVASNTLGQTSTSCTLIVSDLPTSPQRPEVYKLHGDGVLLVWRPVQSIAELTFCIEYYRDGAGWSRLADGVVDSCYCVNSLSIGAEYIFRVACFNRAGAGPFSHTTIPIAIESEQKEFHAPLVYTSTPLIKPHQDTLCFATGDRTYTFLSEINRGRFSVVLQCQENPGGRLFAAKVMFYKPERRLWVLHEYQLLRKLQHLHVAQLHAGLFGPNHLVLIQELCIGHELLQHLANRDLYGEMHVQEFLQQILGATHYLHESHVLHLDLTSENILVVEGNHVKVVDFGCAQSFVPGMSVPEDQLLDLHGNQAPEILDGRGAVPETDIWSIGIMAFIMLSADEPFQGHVDREKDHESEGCHSRRWKVSYGKCYSSLSEGALNFLKRTLNHKPRCRPSAAECLQLPWIQGERQHSKHRDVVVCFPTEKLRSYLQERDTKSQHNKTTVEVSL